MQNSMWVSKKKYYYMIQQIHISGYTYICTYTQRKGTNLLQRFELISSFAALFTIVKELEMWLHGRVFAHSTQSLGFVSQY